MTEELDSQVRFQVLERSKIETGSPNTADLNEVGTHIEQKCNARIEEVNQFSVISDVSFDIF